MALDWTFFCLGGSNACSVSHSFDYYEELRELELLVLRISTQMNWFWHFPATCVPSDKNIVNAKVVSGNTTWDHASHLARENFPSRSFKTLLEKKDFLAAPLAQKGVIWTNVFLCSLALVLSWPLFAFASTDYQAAAPADQGSFPGLPQWRYADCGRWGIHQRRAELQRGADKPQPQQHIYRNVVIQKQGLDAFKLTAGHKTHHFFCVCFLGGAKRNVVVSAQYPLDRFQTRNNQLSV